MKIRTIMIMMCVCMCVWDYLSARESCGGKLFRRSTRKPVSAQAGGSAGLNLFAFIVQWGFVILMWNLHQAIMRRQTPTWNIWRDIVRAFKSGHFS